MASRFTSKSIFLIMTIVALACGWFVDHLRLTATLRTQIQNAEVREDEVRTGVRALTDATETWLVSKAYSDSSPEDFSKIVTHNLLYDLYQLSENESQVNSLGGATADYWARKILAELNCDSVDELFKLALSLDQYDNLPDEIYLIGTSEHDAYRKFLEKTFAENSEP